MSHNQCHVDRDGYPGYTHCLFVLETSWRIPCDEINEVGECRPSDHEQKTSQNNVQSRVAIWLSCNVCRLFKSQVTNTIP